MNPDQVPATDLPDLLPARMLNEFVYCPRLFYLEYVQGEFVDSSDTVEGRFKHRRVEKEGGALPPAEGEGKEEEAKIHAKSVLLSGDKCGLIAKMDLIEGEGKKLTPVDYKRGKTPGVPGKVWPADLVQICAQAMILRENGYECGEGVVYYSESKERVTVPIDDGLVERTRAQAKEARECAASGKIPAPLVDSPKCPRCSLVGICLPDEVTALGTESLYGTGGTEDVRRLYPARDDAIPFYVQEQRATITKQGEELVVKCVGDVIARGRLMEISSVAVFGNPQITTQAVHELCRRDIPICHFSHGGWFYGITHGMGHKNIELRRRQYAVAEDRSKAIFLARWIVQGKVANCRTMLRRNARDASEAALKELAGWIESATNAKSSDELFGIEGSAGRIYFMHFRDMLKQEQGEFQFDFQTRNRRPPKDPVNAMLSFVYAMLTKDVTVTLLAVGFDPYLGFYHVPKYGRPALALDMMEEFRPIIADSVVIGMINNGEVAPSDFASRGGSCTMTPDGRKKVIRAFERRLDSLVTHPMFGYTVSYRRILEVQARLLGRYLSGEIKEYPPFCTR